MLSSLRKRVKKVGQPPGTATYTGKKSVLTHVELFSFNDREFKEASSMNLEEVLPSVIENGITWINVEGLSNVPLIQQIAERYHLHPLTVEDILNVDQRPKIDEYDDYLFVCLKILFWNDRKKTFSIEQFSMAFGKNYVLSFQEHDSEIFDSIKLRLKTTAQQRLRQQSSDYLAYRLIDIVVDQYFVVLEGLGEIIEDIEESIIADPSPKNARTLYRLKRKMLMLRRTVWPMREVVSHLTQAEPKYISKFTRVYFRDVYDHTVQAIDTIETFRDMLSGMVDMYLSSLTTRMNEIMKVLTIISTIFIPIMFIASVYGMNFKFMPELDWRYGYPVALGLMAIVASIMLIYFRKKKWL